MARTPSLCVEIQIYPFQVVFFFVFAIFVTYFVAVQLPAGLPFGPYWVDYNITDGNNILHQNDSHFSILKQKVTTPAEKGDVSYVWGYCAHLVLDQNLFTTTLGYGFLKHIEVVQLLQLQRGLVKCSMPWELGKHGMLLGQHITQIFTLDLVCSPYLLILLLMSILTTLSNELNQVDNFIDIAIEYFIPYWQQYGVSTSKQHILENNL